MLTFQLVEVESFSVTSKESTLGLLESEIRFPVHDDFWRFMTKSDSLCVIIISNQAGRAKSAELAGFYRASCQDLLGSQKGIGQ